MDIIKCLKYGYCKMTEERVEMKSIARGFFEKLFTLKSGVCKMSYILSRVERCITEEANLSLTTVYVEEDVFWALKDMGPTKVPRIDDFSTIYSRYFGTLWVRRYAITGLVF